MSERETVGEPWIGSELTRGQANAEDREVSWVDDLEILPDQTRDDTDAGWGERRDRRDSADRHLLEERPPHWD